MDRRLTVLNVRPAVVELLAEQRINLAAAAPPPTATPQEGQDLRVAINESFVVRFRPAMWVAAGLAVGSAFVAAVTIDGGAWPRADLGGG